MRANTDRTFEMTKETERWMRTKGDHKCDQLDENEARDEGNQRRSPEQSTR